MPQPIKDRPMTADEIERLRLVLSTFRDGSGQYMARVGFMPSYLDFERATAYVLGGTTSENKNVFDVTIDSPGGLPYGISCKMAVTQPARNEASFMELSNSQAKFATAFALAGVDWRTQPELAGPIVVDLVTSWHDAEKDRIDLAGSRYLVLEHDAPWSKFRLLCFTLDLHIADPRTQVEWCNEGRDAPEDPSTVAGYIDYNGRRHRLWQLYQKSGGQLKYYPPLAWAEWTTATFELEEPPIVGLRDKVEVYFPDMWPT